MPSAIGILGLFIPLAVEAGGAEHSSHHGHHAGHGNNGDVSPSTMIMGKTTFVVGGNGDDELHWRRHVEDCGTDW